MNKFPSRLPTEKQLLQEASCSHNLLDAASALQGICSLVTNDYISQAYSLYSELDRVSSGFEYYIFTIGLINEADVRHFDSLTGIFHLVPIENILSRDDLACYVSRYTPFELTCALRGVCHAYLFDKTQLQAWLMVDTDIFPVSSPAGIFDILKSSEIFLTKHSSRPVDVQYSIPHEKNLLTCGLYNGGVVGFSRGEQAKAAIDFLVSRLEHWCEDSFSRKAQGLPSRFDFLFVDQLWLNLLPIYFDSCYISSSPSHNLGHWNLWEGQLEADSEGRLLFESEPVVFIHFSGLNTDLPSNVSRYTTLYDNYSSSSLALWSLSAESYISNNNRARSIFGSRAFTYTTKSNSEVTLPRSGILPRVSNYLQALPRRLVRKLLSN